MIRCRERLKRALLATVVLAQGTPMLAAGDELGHTQGGNNNPYCQDNPTTWIAWPQADQTLIDFTARLLELRRTLMPLASRWYTGLPDSRGVHDLAWLRSSGQPLTSAEWGNRMSRVIGALIGVPGQPGPALLLLINGRDADASFSLPPGDWLALLDTSAADGSSDWRRAGAESYPLRARSVALLRDQAPEKDAHP